MNSRRPGLSLIRIWVFTLAVSLLFSFSIKADDLDDFLEESEASKEAIFIDIEEETRADFDVIDKISKRQKAIEKKRYKRRQFKKPRKISEGEIFKAQLKKGAILVDIKSKKSFKVKSPIMVTAKMIIVGGNLVYIYDKKGKEKYKTEAMNVIDIERVVSLYPEIDHIKTYSDMPRYGLKDKKTNFSHFLTYHAEAMRTNYYPTIFRGTQKTGNSYQLQLKSYLLKKDFPVQAGLSIATQLGFWEDPTLGVSTWGGIFYGPTLMRSFWHEQKNQWNFHFSAFRSLVHRSRKNPDAHSFSTNGIQLELEKQIDTRNGPFSIGVSYRLSRSSVKSTTEYLENEASRGKITAVGVSVGYRFDWVL